MTTRTDQPQPIDVFDLGRRGGDVKIETSAHYLPGTPDTDARRIDVIEGEVRVAGLPVLTTTVYVSRRANPGYGLRHAQERAAHTFAVRLRDLLAQAPTDPQLDATTDGSRARG